MDLDKSLSAKLLDDWVRPTFDTILMPTLLDHYGSEEDFWTLEDKMITKRRATTQNAVRAFQSLTHSNSEWLGLKSADNTDKRYLIDVLQEIIDSLYPREFRKLDQADLLYRVVSIHFIPVGVQDKAHYVQARQRILNWRRGFYERATKIVKAGYEQYKSKTRHATTANLKKWAVDAVDPDKGHAFWEFPPTHEVSCVRFLALVFPFVLLTLGDL